MKKNKKLYRILLLAAVVLLLIAAPGLNRDEAAEHYAAVQDVNLPSSAVPAADMAATPEDSAMQEAEPEAAEGSSAAIDEYGTYDSKDEVALYIRSYGHLPYNYISKAEAEEAGWSGGSVEKYCPGKCIGGSRFGNYEGLLPEADGRRWTECDINTLGASSRGAERIVFSNDGLIYYTSDHYESFELLYD